jgi:hypothetical protein
VRPESLDYVVLSVKHVEYDKSVLLDSSNLPAACIR